MARTRQHAIEFDSLEEKVLLSAGMADPAVTVYQHKTLRFHLTGALYGLPSGTSGPNGYIVSSFLVNGHLASMGNVNGAFYLTDRFIPIGKLPDLSKASLVLVNQKGSINIALNASRSAHYKFTIMSGSGTYTYALGKGNLTISASHNSLDFIIKFHARN